jgi:predicted nucleotidyltransferase
MADLWIEKFKTSIVPIIIKELKPEKLVIFGSRIIGNADENSDIDVLVVATIFSEIPFVRRMPFVLKKISFDKHVDFICYSPDEFERNKNASSVVADALKYGEFLLN